MNSVVEDAANMVCRDMDMICALGAAQKYLGIVDRVAQAAGYAGPRSSDDLVKWIEMLKIKAAGAESPEAVKKAIDAARNLIGTDFSDGCSMGPYLSALAAALDRKEPPCPPKP